LLRGEIVTDFFTFSTHYIRPKSVGEIQGTERSLDVEQEKNRNCYYFKHYKVNIKKHFNKPESLNLQDRELGPASFMSWKAKRGHRICNC